MRIKTEHLARYFKETKKKREKI